MQNDSEVKINTLVSLYNNISSEILFYQNQGDNTSILNLITIAIVPLLDVFGVTKEIVSIATLLAPLAQLLSLQRGLQAHTFVAMLRGYSSYLEEKINNMLEETIFVYNSKLIDEYIAKQTSSRKSKMKISWLVTILVHSAVLLVCIVFFIISNLTSPWYYFLIAGIIFIFYLYKIIKLVIAFCKKEEKRYEAKQFCYKLNRERS